MADKCLSKNIRMKRLQKNYLKKAIALIEKGMIFLYNKFSYRNQMFSHTAGDGSASTFQQTKDYLHGKFI